MPLPLLVSVQPERIQTGEVTGLSLQQISYLGACFVKATTESNDAIIDFIHQNFTRLAIFVDVRSLQKWDHVVDILNAGASKIFVTFEQLKELAQEPTITPERLVLNISLGSPRTDITKLKTYLESDSRWRKEAWAFDGSKDKEQVDQVLKELGNYPPSSDQTLFIAIPDKINAADILHSYPGDSLIVSSERLTFDSSKDENRIPAAELLLAGAFADRKTGLFNTTVVDEHSVALGSVWSSKESVSEALRTGSGVYQSRKRGLWYKGASSGDTQELLNLGWDCDKDSLLFRVRQKGRGFCHRGTATCWGPTGGLSKLEKTVQDRKRNAEEGSYTARLFKDPKLLRAKIKEEADELCEAATKEDIAAEAADLMYFALTRCVAADVGLEDIEKNLDLKSLKIKRRKGDAKPQYAEDATKLNGVNGREQMEEEKKRRQEEAGKEATSTPRAPSGKAGQVSGGQLRMKRHSTADTCSDEQIRDALKRPSQRTTDTIMDMVNPIISDVRDSGDVGVLKYTHKFEKATSLKKPYLASPFLESLMTLDEATKAAIDISFDNILKFHAAQKDESTLLVATMPGVKCSRFSRPIERVGLYIPGGTAVLPSTAMMLGVPALVAGCSTIILATPPRQDGTVTPEIVYIAHKIGAKGIVLAGGAQAIAAMAYGTESISKVDKILGPGNQFVTAAKMVVSNDTNAAVSIDMPAGPSEVLVMADKTADPSFVAIDLLSQAEHGTDSQVVLIAIDLTDVELDAIEDALQKHAATLPRRDIIQAAISHSTILRVRDIVEAIEWSNHYAPEHLILQVSHPEVSPISTTADPTTATVASTPPSTSASTSTPLLSAIKNAGSVFLGPWTPESVGDYSAGVNHSLPTYGYARQYSGVGLSSFIKYTTCSQLSKEGLKNVGPSVMQLAKVEGLEAHRRAVQVRFEKEEWE